jgi:transcriptional regulator with GAF, ATPase, and Fis domain
MIKVTRELAERMAQIADLLLSDDSADAPVRQLANLSLELIPASAAAGVVAAGDTAWTHAASSPSVAELHRLQLHSGAGPVADALRYGEARRIDDTSAEERWPEVCQAMAQEQLLSCLVLPLRTDRSPGGALAVYGQQRNAFTGASHDLALLFAAQGGVAVRNATAYRNCRKLVENLQTALASRAVIEQAKGIIVAEHGVTPEVAFKRLSALSQNSNRKLREIAADVVAGRVRDDQFGDEN